ncbi:MAG: cyanophycin synthetase, partial [Pseudomonadota bacterium]
TTFFQAPGRMNVFDEHPFRVILDYAHNAAAMKTMCQTISRLDVNGQRIATLAAPGDRRDEDIEAIATEAAGHFDHYVLKADDHRRGRGFDEVPQMLKRVLIARGVDEANIEIIPDEQAAIDHSLTIARDGDLVIVFGDEVHRSWKQIIHFEVSGEQRQAAESKPTKVSSIVTDPAAFELDEADEIIRDERGVRLASRETEDAD